MSKKRKIALAIYGLVIIIALIYIVFFAPDSFFIKKGDKTITNLNEIIKPQKVDFKIQKENLLHNNYDYEYILVDSRTSPPKNYNCTGTITDGKREGTCTSPDNVTYTDANFKEVFKYIYLNYLDPTYILELLDNSKVTTNDLEAYVDYVFNTKYQTLDTSITVRTNNENITDIIVINLAMQYHIKISNIKV